MTSILLLLSAFPRRVTLGGRLAFGIGLLVGSALTSPAGAADVPAWEIAPYRVHVTLAIDDAARPQGNLSTELARGVEQRIATALRPLWQTTLITEPDAAARRFAIDPQPIGWDEMTSEQHAFDKLMWLGIEAHATGYRLTCREFDAYTRRWGPTLRRDVAQSASLTEAAFRLLTDAFTPLARVEAPNDEGVSQLVMKGGALPRAEGADLLVAPGDVYLPLLRRTGRGGELVENGIVGIPWTYLVTTEPSRSGWESQVESALRGALSGRRRGGIEQIAISLRNAPDPPRVRFYARSSRDQPLIGYEVFRLPGPKAAPVLIGLTDRNGEIVVPPEGGPVSTLLLRSDGQVLAKLLVAAGTAPTIDAPIADDAIRLAAQGEVQAVREELIDVVARRAILIARIQSHLKKGEGARARELMDELTDLPTSSAFVRRIDLVHDRLPASGDPRVRQAVDGLFTATRDLLARFLDARTITNLQAEVNAAGGG
jgi:hypothetical protein